MKRLPPTRVLVIALGIGIVGFALTFAACGSESDETGQGSTNGSGTGESMGGATSRTKTMGEVEATVTWPAEGKTDVVLALNTHSVDLSGYKPEEKVRLVTAAGDKVAPTSVRPEGDSHHQSFVLSFASLDDAKALEVGDPQGSGSAVFKVPTS